MIKSPKERFHFLDGLRGIASAMIVFHHSFTGLIVRLCTFLKVPVLGFYITYFTQSGVELFFVLSGVVLLRPYLRNQRKFRPGDYFLRRVKRIYPPYFFALLFAAFVIWYLNNYPTWYIFKGNHMVYSVSETLKELFIFNFNGNYYNLAWWSLQIEILFYLLVPFCIFIFPRTDKINNKNMAITIAGTLTATLILQLWLSEYYPQIFTYKINIGTLYRFICYPVCFLMGMYLAAKDFDRRTARIFIFSGVLLIGVSWFYEPIVSPGYGLVYAGVVILSFNVKSFKRFLSTPFMIWLGERSYSLFLIHFSVFYLVDCLSARIMTSRNIYYGVLTRGAGIPLALFAAMLLFHFVERRQAHGLVTGDMFWPWQTKKMKRIEYQG
jgi:peptidoglycan/LPS O-acetylase OafA/YrhL